MKYMQLIKHPLPPIRQEFDEYIKEMKKIKPEYYRMALYHAEVLDGVLAVTVFLYHNGYRGGKNETVIRHFYDGERYATQRASDNKRLEGSISYYLEYSFIREIGNANDVIKTYLKCTEKNKTGISALRELEQKILDKRLEIKHKKITDIVDMRMSAVSENPPDEFFGWINDWVLMKARYFFYKYRKGKKQRGYCSHCRKEYDADNVRHGEKIICPRCGSELICKALGKVTQYTIRDSATVAYVQEITENGSPALVERIYGIKQDIASHREGPRGMKKEVLYEEIKRFFLTPDTLSGITAKGKYKTDEYVYGYFKGKGPLRWCAIDDCQPASAWFNNDMWIYPGNINGIFKNSGIPKIRNIEASAVVPVFAKELRCLVKALKEMPVLENFAKLGFCNMFRAIAQLLTEGEYYCGERGIFEYIKSNFMTVYETLGIPKDVLMKMGDITENEYLLYKRLERIAPIKLEIFGRYTESGLCDENYSYSISTLLKDHRIGAERFIGYFEKQKKLLKIKAGEVLNFYSDYLKMVKELRMPKTESVLFPTDVKKEHDRLMKIKTDRIYDEQNKMLKKRVKILEMLCYEEKEFIIRPLKNADEFLKESSILNHCVKTYINDCANGKTNIFGIRRAESPDVPYFTLELSNNGTVTHNLGKSNCHPPKEVKAFVKRWEKKVVEKNKQKFVEAANGKPQKVRITA